MTRSRPVEEGSYTKTVSFERPEAPLALRWMPAVGDGRDHCRIRDGRAGGRGIEGRSAVARGVIRAVGSHRLDQSTDLVVRQAFEPTTA
jgi:hypothetical protein